MPFMRVSINLPDGYLTQALQMLQNLEKINPEQIQISVWVDAKTLTVEEMESLVDDVDPPFKYKRIIRTKDGERVVVDS